MKKVRKILLFVAVIALALILKGEKSEAAAYRWPIGGSNANETYKDYSFYGQAYAQPIKDGKSGREYKVNNKLWPNEKYYYASCESHFGMDITGKSGHTYSVVSVCPGTVLGTSKNYAYYPGDNYVDRNQRRTSEGLRDGGGYGNYIIIQEASTGRCFLYAHLKGGSLKVKKGDTVKAGQTIATMGSSGDSGHMHLHFEIRKNKASMISAETRYGYHYLAITNSNTNLDPEQYIGSKPYVHTPVTDKKLVKLSKADAKLYIKYVYKTFIGEEPTTKQLDTLYKKYSSTGSIAEATKSILASKSSIIATKKMNNESYVKKVYEVILCRGKNYTDKEISGYISKLNTGIWNRTDFLVNVCNSNEFVKEKAKAIVKKQKDADKKKEQDEINRILKLPFASKDKIKMKGDLDGDNRVNSSDASLCLALIKVKNRSEVKYLLPYADMNGDGQVTTADAMEMLSYYAKNSTGR